VDDLASAIAEFEKELPGWWWSVGSCSVSKGCKLRPGSIRP
jgi:hypothetical protein